MSWLLTSLLLLLGFINFAIAGAVVIRDHRKLDNIAFSAFSFSIGLWVVGIAGFLRTQNSVLALDWAQFYYIAPLLIAVSGIVFAEAFHSSFRIRRQLLYPVLLGFLLFCIPLIFHREFLINRLIYHYWGKEIVLNVVPYSVYTLYIISFYVIVLDIFRRKSKILSGLYARQAGVLFKGVTTSAIFGLLFDLILPLLKNYQYIWIGPLFTSFIVVVVGYSIVRQRMFDIRLAIARSLGYVLSLAVLSGFYGFMVFGVATRIAGLHFALSTQVALSVATGIASLSFNRLRTLFNRATNRLFYQDAYDAQAFMDQLNQALVNNIELKKLLEACSRIIDENLKSEYCLFGIKETHFQELRIFGSIKKSFSDEDITKTRQITPNLGMNVMVVDDLPTSEEKLKQILVSNNIAVLVRLVPASVSVKERLEGIGYIILGQKRSGNAYTSKDVQILSIIANELVVAVQNALHFEEIQQFNVTLQQKVDDATRKLRRTNERLEELDETKDDFISMASHQLRTPLTSVKGYLSMVLEGDAGKVNATQTEMLHQAFSSSQRMVYLITDLLNVSRLKTGKFVIESTPVDLSKVVEEEVAQLVETAQVKNVKLTYDKPANFPILMLDETKTRQVGMNFIDNAIYYTPSSGRIKVELIDKPTTVELRVIDDGIGVPKAEQHHLFTKFYRATNARKARPDGTGLGLFMAKKVIAAEGGSIIFESKEGQGSTFGFVFSKAKLKLPTQSPNDKENTETEVKANAPTKSLTPVR